MNRLNWYALITALFFTALLLCGCVKTCETHIDADNDLICDVCGATLTPTNCETHVDSNQDGICDICGEDMPTQPTQNPSKVRFSTIPQGVETFSGVEVYLGETQLPLYSVQVNLSQAWTASDYNRSASAVGYFELAGQVTVTVKLPYGIDYSSVVRPLSAKIIPIADIEAQTLTFTIKSAGNYVLEVNGDKTKAIHLFVSDYNENKAQEIAQYQNAEHYIYFGAGVHTAENSSYINTSNEIILLSNTVVYIDDGAVVQGRFYANGRTNVTICGNGIIDGSVFTRNAQTGERLIPIDFNFCTSVTLKDFSLLDPAGWTVNFYFNTDCEISNVKIISSRSNGDGISLQSCKNITVDNCFVRSWDDSLVVKNYPNYTNGNADGATENITFTNCTLWTDLAQCMEIGYETVGETLKDVTFENITVLHALHKPVISIHNANNAVVSGITFKNITVEDFSTGGGDAGANCELIDIRVLFSSSWSTNHKTTSLGSVDGVVIDNVLVISGKAPKITLGGCTDTRSAYFGNISTVKNITITNITYKGINLTQSSSQLTLNCNQYVSYYSVTSTQTATGAAFNFSQTQTQLEEYTAGLTVEILNN